LSPLGLGDVIEIKGLVCQVVAVLICR